MNPYRCEKRAADTMNLVFEGRLQFRLFAPDPNVPDGAPRREWRPIGGPIGSWHEAAIRYANLFLDAGLIDYARDGAALDEWTPFTSAWSDVRATRAGEYLWRTWRDEPFRVIPLATVPHLKDEVAESLSVAYVEQAGLLEDDRHRYVESLRPHAERVVADLLNVHKGREGTWR